MRRKDLECKISFSVSGSGVYSIKVYDDSKCFCVKHCVPLPCLSLVSTPNEIYPTSSFRSESSTVNSTITYYCLSTGTFLGVLFSRTVSLVVPVFRVLWQVNLQTFGRVFICAISIWSLVVSLRPRIYLSLLSLINSGVHDALRRGPHLLRQTFPLSE